MSLCVEAKEVKWEEPACRHFAEAKLNDYRPVCTTRGWTGASIPPKTSGANSPPQFHRASLFYGVRFQSMGKLQAKICVVIVTANLLVQPNSHSYLVAS